MQEQPYKAATAKDKIVYIFSLIKTGKKIVFSSEQSHQCLSSKNKSKIKKVKIKTNSIYIFYKNG